MPSNKPKLYPLQMLAVISKNCRKGVENSTKSDKKEEQKKKGSNMV